MRRRSSGRATFVQLPGGSHLRFTRIVQRRLPLALLAPLALAFSSGCAAGAPDLSPDAICNHMKSLVEKEKRDDATERNMKQCKDSAAELEKDLSKEDYEKFATCVLSATEFEQAEKDCSPK